MYDFKSLSPLDFEDLVRDLLQAELGIRLESFGPGRDQGIDCRHAVGESRLIVQAKHLAGSPVNAVVAAARGEDAKVKALAPSRYILATSLPLTPQLKKRIREAIPSAPLVDGDILGHAELNNLLGRHKSIEQQHFKLWLTSSAVLERILHSGVYNRTLAEMDLIRSMIPRYVQNVSTSEAEAILAKVGALIIAGEPGVGKTTLARVLLWLHAEQGWKIFVVDDIKEAYEVADANEKRLIFFDDFLGQVRLSLDLVRSVDQGLPRLLARVRENKHLRFILTTRDYILSQAQAHAQRLDPQHIGINQLVLRVGSYTRGIRARILYNHLYHTSLSSTERDQLLADDFFLKIIDHNNFNPRLIDHLTSADYVSVSGTPIRDAVMATLDHPQTLWDKPFRSHISETSRALLRALFFNPAEIPIESLQRSFGRVIDTLELPIAKADRPVRFRAAVKEVEGSFITLANRRVSFANPGVRDFVGRVIGEDGYLKYAITAVAEYKEVYQCWNYFSTPTARPWRGHPLTEDWSRAAARMIATGFGSPLERFRLVLDMYNDLKNDELLELVRQAVQEIEESEPDECDADECVATLEAATLNLLPFDDLERVKDVCFRNVAARMSSNGVLLTLEEIASIARTLSSMSDDIGTVNDTVREALSDYLRGLDDTLDEIASLNELKEFERELKASMKQYKLQSYEAECSLDRRREELEEKEVSDDWDYYVARSSNVSAETTIIEIRSMFWSLKHR